MKIIKIILVLVVLLAALVGAGLYWASKNIDLLVHDAIETIGGDLTEVKVAVGEVNISLTDGRAELHELTVANVKGYTAPEMFSLTQVALQIDPLTLADEVIVIDEILIDGASLTVEHKGVSDTNIQDLMKTLEENVPTSDKAVEAETSASTLRFMVKKLVLKNNIMDVVSPSMEPKSLDLKDIQRTNIGSKNNGLSAEALTQALIQPILEQAQYRFTKELGRGVSRMLDENLSDEDKAQLDGLKEKFKGFKLN